MTKTVPFPNNYQAFLEKAMNAIQGGNLPEAITSLKKALELHVEKEVFYLCLTLMRESAQSEEALALLRKYQPYLFESIQVEALDLELITLLIETNHLAEAQKQMNQRSVLLENKAEFEQIQVLLQEKLLMAVHRKEAETQKNTREMIAEGKIITQKNYYEQIQWVRKLEELPMSDLIEVSSYILTMSLHPLLKTEVLSLLVEREVKGYLLVSKPPFEGRVDVSELPAIPASSFYLQGVAVIDNDSNIPFSEKDKIKDIFFLHCAFYYPFEQAAFHSPEAWLAIMQQQVTTEEWVEVAENIAKAERGLDSLTEL